MPAPALDLADILTRPEPATWLFAGDSITQGAVHTRGWRDYTELFRERLGELARQDVVINTAVGGWSVSALLPRLEERVLRFRPHVLLLMFGTNDAVGGAEGVPGFAASYARLVEQARAASIRHLVVQTAVPMMPVDPDRAIAMGQWHDEKIRAAKLHGLRMRTENLENYVEATRRLARETGLPLIDHWRAWEAAGTQRGELLDGGFHPNEYGHRLIAHTLFRHCGLWDDRSWTCRLFVPAHGALGPI